MTNSMHLTPIGSPHRSHRSHHRAVRVSLAAAASVIMILAWIFTNSGGTDAGASDLAANPTLSMYYECTAGEYFYNVIMKNLGGTVSTNFTVITQIGSTPQKVGVYPIAPDAELSISVLLPEGC